MSSHTNLTPEAFAATVEKYSGRADIELIQSDPHHLLIDVDGGGGGQRRVKRLAEKLFGLEFVDTWKSKSGQGWHELWRSPEPLDFVTRVALQAMLGSDPVRELLSLRAHHNGVVEPSLLFKPRRTDEEA